MSIANHALAHKNILITGATGFIGSRLAARLAAEEGAAVTGSGRHLARVAHLETHGVRLVRADLLDEAATAATLAGQEIVFHLAAWLRAHGDEAQAYAFNVTATERLLRQAAAAGVRRFIFTSSVNAYGPSDRAVLDETAPLDTELRDVYGRTKAIADLRVRELGAGLGIEVVVIRPGMVYGPGAISWTVDMVNILRRGLPVIFGDGRGHAMPVYIDNLVDGLILAAVSPNAPGEAFNLCDPVVDWHTFFGYYAAMCGHPPRAIPMWAARILAWASEHFRFLGLPLTRERLAFYVMAADYPSTKAENLLGYRQRIPIAEGMRHAETWLRQTGHLHNR
ncbi:MAG: NAD-dependent epimerase/dehydratase family protein [Caldilineaceae bacterium]|nr:NAD-dependent epimerase/dehydratase family protein [Caldilineaceae bacterium]